MNPGDPSKVVIDFAAASRDKATYAVFANGMRVGDIPVLDYEALRQDARRNMGLYKQLAISYFERGGRVLRHGIRAIPGNCFWLAAAMAILAPTEFGMLAASLTDPVSAAPAVLHALRWGVFISMGISTFVEILVGDTFRPISVFEERIDHTLRHRFNLPANCEIYVDVEKVFNR